MGILVPASVGVEPDAAELTPGEGASTATDPAATPLVSDCTGTSVLLGRNLIVDAVGQPQGPLEPTAFAVVRGGGSRPPGEQIIDHGILPAGIGHKKPRDGMTLAMPELACTPSPRITNDGASRTLLLLSVDHDLQTC